MRMKLSQHIALELPCYWPHCSRVSRMLCEFAHVGTQNRNRAPNHDLNDTPFAHASAANPLHLLNLLHRYTSGVGGEDCLDYDAALILANFSFLVPDQKAAISAVRMLLVCFRSEMQCVC